MEQRNLQIRKSVRVFTIGKATPRIKHLWICLHGYGQLADWFGKRFEKYASKERLFVFPEGPHRFYVTGTSGRVGASWMTKEDRINDIEDQFNYLETLVNDLRSSLAPECKIHVLGFSQGVATALRWIDRSTILFNTLICWAGTFPPDIDYRLNNGRFRAIVFHACFGDKDEFITAEKAAQMLDQLRAQDIQVESHFYRGGHRLQPELLEMLILDAESR